MSSDVESQLVEKLKTSKFSIQLDKSAVSDNRAILMVYVCFIDDAPNFVKRCCLQNHWKLMRLSYPFLKLQNFGLTKIKYHLETWYPAQRMVLHPCLVSRMALLLI